MGKYVDAPAYLHSRRWAFSYEDDFFTEDTGVWTTTADAGGTDALDADGTGGIFEIITDGDDNDETYIETPEWFKFIDGQPLEFQALVLTAEASTDDCNFICGLMDAPGADTLVDNGAGPKTSYSGMVFYKVDGGTLWNVQTSLGATQTSTLLNQAGSKHNKDYAFTGDGSNYQWLEGIWRPLTSADGVATFKINGEVVASHHFVYTSATEMAFVIGAKAGGANAETVKVDYVSITQNRKALPTAT